MGEDGKRVDKAGIVSAVPESNSSSKSSVTLARDPKSLHTRSERVEYCCDLMRSGAWDRGKSAAKLAVIWGIQKSSAESYSAEASRRVFSEVKDPERLMMKGLSGIERAGDDSMRDAAGLDENGNPLPADERPTRLEVVQLRKTAVDAYHKLLTLAGAAAPQKVVLELEKLSDEEVERRYREAQARLLGKGEEGETDE